MVILSWSALLGKDPSQAKLYQVRFESRARPVSRQKRDEEKPRRCNICVDPNTRPFRPQKLSSDTPSAGASEYGVTTPDLEHFHLDMTTGQIEVLGYYNIGNLHSGDWLMKIH